MTEFAAQLTNVGKHYRHFELRDISLTLPTGSITGFIGANGAGKSTTLRIMLGLVHQDRGSVKVLGQAMPDGQIAAKRDIGYVSEDMRLYKTATIGWHMDFIRSIYPAWDVAYAAELLKRFDLKAEQNVRGLSHGQRVKAALLLALARRPRLLVLDEPTTGLDPVARQEVLAALMEILQDEQRSILFSSQNTQDVEQISDQIAFIDKGEMVTTGSKEEMLDRWRRLQIRVPASEQLPELPGIVQQQASGQIHVLVTSHYVPDTAQRCLDAGCTLLDCDPMTLEEIFVAAVAARRAEGLR